jgi:hypothetical protein
VPLVITSAVVLSCLLVLLLDWAFSQLYVRLPDIVPAHAPGHMADVLAGVSLGGASELERSTMHAEGETIGHAGLWHGEVLKGEGLRDDAAVLEELDEFADEL